ncbi:helix-turn-helix transcriptional regulator [Streptomyces sp. NPDC002790]|uniref:helix-turn-helix domain-containing protein n=1 Tax=Streptomyces sp. NPDC002790 TaxID=3154431 RepID=UPI0033265022
MPPRSTPTARQKRLGVELRKMRTAAGITTEAAAGLLGVPRTNVPNMESGRSGISPDRVRTLAGHYACVNPRLVDALAEMAAERGKGWWEDYRGRLPATFLDIAELEWHARRLRVAVTVHLPGLIQTEAHARAVFKQVIPQLPAVDVDTRVAHRMERCRILDRSDPPQLDLVIHEAALRMEFGGAQVAHRQLARVLQAAEHPQVTVRVIPFKAGGFPGAGQSVVYAEGPVPELDTVELDSTHGPEFVDSASQLQKYRAQLDATEGAALPPDPSLDLIRTLASSL